MNNFNDNLRISFTREVWKDFCREWESLSIFKKFAAVDKANRPRIEKETSYQKLEKYRNDSDIYISYINALSDIPSSEKKKAPSYPKIGINPKSHYNTPLGVYTYPLREIWKDIEGAGSLAGVPYQGNSPYIAILRVKPDANFVEDMYNDYDSSDYDEDIQKMKRFFIPNLLNESEFDSIIGNALDTAKVSNPVVSMWNVVRYLSFIIVEMKKPNVDREKVIKKIHKFSLDDLLPSKEKGKLNPYGLSFNRILNGVLGYDGFGDKSGKGYIHHAEAIQAVFLNPVAFEVVEIIFNDKSGPTNSLNVERSGADSKSRKLQDLINEKGDKISKKNWRDILIGYPIFWGDCPHLDVLKDPEVIRGADKYWSGIFKNLDSSSIKYVSLPDHLGLLHDAKRILIEKWESIIKNLLPEGESGTGINIPSYDSIPDVVMKDVEFVSFFKKSVKNYIINGSPLAYIYCPFEDIQKDPEVLAVVKKYWINKINEDPAVFRSCPKALVMDFPEIYKTAIDSSILKINERPGIWDGLVPDIRNDSRVLKALAESWKKKVYNDPARFESLPKHLKDDLQYLEIAKKSILEHINLARGDRNKIMELNMEVPHTLLKDEEVLSAWAKDWMEILNKDNIFFFRYVPEVVIKQKDFVVFGTELWKSLLRKDPGKYWDDCPYEDAKRDRGVWEAVLNNPRLAPRFYGRCPFDDLKQDPVIKGVVVKYWTEYLISNPSLIGKTSSVPKILQSEIMQNPVIRKLYLKSVRYQASIKPIDLEYFKLEDSEVLEAYQMGVREFAINHPLESYTLNKKDQVRLLKDPEINKLWLDA